MIESIAPLLEAGRVKLYCVESYDSWTWHDRTSRSRSAAQRHGHYEDWILDRVVPVDRTTTRPAAATLIVTGCSFGAYHAANFCLKRADLFPLAICQSGVYDVSVVGWGERGDSRLLQQPGRLRRQPRRRPPRLAAQSGEPPARRAGRGSGRTRRARSSRRTVRGSSSGEGDPLRARPLGPRRPARLALVARAARATTCRGSVDGERSTSIGLLLGTEEDWPTAYEALVQRVGSFTYDGETHELVDRAGRQRAVRPALRAALLARDRPARVVVLPAARVAEEDRADGRRLPAEQPVHVPGDGEARRVLRDDPARPEGAGDVAAPAQAAAAERALRVRDRQVRGDGLALQRALRPRRGRRARRLPALHEAVRRRPVGRRDAHRRPGRAARGLRRLGRADDALPGVRRGLRRLRALALDRGRDDGHEVRPVEAASRPLLGRSRLPERRDRRRGRDDLAARERLLPLGVQQLRDADQGRRGVPDRLRERVAGRGADEPALLLPVGDEGARALDAPSARRPAGRTGSTRTRGATSRSATATTCRTRRSSRRTGELADDFFEVERYEEFCAEALPHLDEVVLEYVESDDFDRLLVQTVQTTFPAHEHEHFVAHYRGLLEAWAKDQRVTA